jgi:hypothetical protein
LKKKRVKNRTITNIENEKERKKIVENASRTRKRA